MTTTLTNSFEGGTLTVGVTAGNSGGASGNAFDSTNLGTGATAIYDATHVANGSVACKLNNTSGSTFDQVVWSTSMGTQTQVWYRVYYYFTANPPASVALLQFKSGASLQFQLFMNTSGQLRGIDAALNNPYTFTNAIALNQWIRVEGFVTFSATTGQLETKLFNTASSTTPTETKTSGTSQNTGASASSFFFGHNAQETIWMDDLGLSNAGYLGPAGNAYTIGSTPSITSTVTAAASLGGSVGASLTASASITASMKGNSPEAPVGAIAEIAPDGSWLDITDYVNHVDQDHAGHPVGVTIIRGRQDELTTSPTPSTAGFQLNNSDGRFTSRNPLGAYYPHFSRNTPIRLSGLANEVYVRIEEDNQSCIGTPDSVGLSITGDLEAQVEFELSDWSGGDSYRLADKWHVAGNNSWKLELNTDGTVSFVWTTDGTTELTATSTLPIPIPRGALKATIDVNNGSGGRTITFYTADSITGTYTQLGNAVVQSGTTSIYDSTADVNVGFGAVGRFYGFKLLSGIGGTVKASPDFTSASEGDTSLTDGQGNVWSFAGTAEFSIRDYRFHGELSSIPAQFDVTGQDVWAPVTAAGVLRRLQQAQDPPVMSVMKRGILAKTGNVTPVAYWPGEDLAGSKTLASALDNGVAIRWDNGKAKPAQDTSFACSDPLPVMNSARFVADVPSYSSHGDIVVRFLLDIPDSTSTPNGTVIAKIFTTGEAGNLYLKYNTTGGGELQFVGLGQDGTSLFDTGAISTMNTTGGAQYWVSMEVRYNVFLGVFATLRVLIPGEDVDINQSETVGGTNVGKVTAVHFNNDVTSQSPDIGFGHLTVQSQYEAITDDSNLLNSWDGETAGNRFLRLCEENDITGRIIGYPDVTAAMGPQTSQTLMNLLQECEDTDRGQVFEPRQVFGLTYRTLYSMTNQAARLSLDYRQDALVPPLSPTDDDLYTNNDVTVVNVDGTSSRSTLDSGSSMSTQPPPDGAGRYATTVSVNVNDEDQLTDIAGWLVHTGTVDEERYSSVVVDLISIQPYIEQLQADVKGVDVGERIEIVNPPSFLPPGPISLIVWGFTEKVGDFAHEMTFNCIPGSPYEVAQIEDSLAVVDTVGSTLHANISSGATSISIDSTDDNLWSTAGGDVPFNIIMGGEEMTVTAISGASSPQTFTVTRAVNGIVKAHTAGEAVVLYRPSIVALIG